MVDNSTAFADLGRQFKQQFVVSMACLTATIALIATFIALDRWNDLNEPPGDDTPTQAQGIVSLFILCAATVIIVHGIRVESNVARLGKMFELTSLQRHGNLSRIALVVLVATFLLVVLEIVTIDPSLTYGFVGIMLSSRGTPIVIVLFPGVVIASILTILAKNAIKGFFEGENLGPSREYGMAAIGSLKVAAVFGIVLSSGLLIGVLFQQTIYEYTAAFAIAGLTITCGPLMTIFTSRTTVLFHRAFISPHVTNLLEEK